MIVVVFIVLMIMTFVFPSVRLIFQHPISVVFNFVCDTYNYYRYKHYNDCKCGELVAYVGLFGKGKTLSAVEKVCRYYKLYNNKPVWDMTNKRFVTQKINILSNVNLTSVPFTWLKSMSQIVQCSQNSRDIDLLNNTLTITLVLGDEFSVQMNSRNFKTNVDPLFLNTILTCRHHHISLFYTAQRFGHVDALLRQVTSYVIDCNKCWRLQLQSAYDAWDLENATSTSLVKPFKRFGFFVKNKHYNAYDTLACVDNLSKSCSDGDFLSNEEILKLQQNTVTANLDVIQKPSRQFLKMRKKIQ